MLDFLRFYNRPQRYKAEIRVEIKNIGTKKSNTRLMIPVPITTEYQEIMPIFKERAMSFDVVLNAGENKFVSVPFSARVVPRRYKNLIPPEIIRANEFVIEYLTYGNPIDGLYTAREAREKRIVDCGGFDTLLQDELKKEGFKSTVISGFWNDGKMHAWIEIDGGIPADPSVEYLRRHGRTKKSGELGFVGSDRIAISTWRPGEKFLQHPYLMSQPSKSSQIHYENYFHCTRA
jgi:hypothetical protein